uniref:Uncharacterized protein n=1 Tax=Lactuca sativa TaxID=4236 RepID=A0A9R1UU14_LACSA|nr:hypothetical protein LSAT_V11C800429650 [Lactuca sativa]
MEKQQQRSSSSSSLIYLYCFELQKWCSASVVMLLLCEPHGPHETLGSRYGFLGWVDPPMCQRSIVIIPGLLRTMNRYEVEVGQLKMRLLASLKSSMSTSTSSIMLSSSIRKSLSSSSLF